MRSIPLPREQAPGDVVVASVEAIGRNARVELVGGRLSHLHVGDLLVAVFANRYATQQFEAYARRDGEYGHLLSMGGLCGLVASRHEAVGEPTKLRFLGAVADSEGHPLKLGDYAAAAIPAISRPRVAVVCGSAMDSGKTFTAMSLIKGFVKRGRRAAYIKLTGTASGRDYWTMVDAGACCVLDFVDGGLPSTYLCPVADLLKLYKRLLGIVAANGADWVVIEIADGLLQQETSALLQSLEFAGSVDAWILACSDPLGAYGGVGLLRDWGIEPTAVSGLVSQSPLSLKEIAMATGAQTLTARQLQAGDLVGQLETSQGVPISDPMRKPQHALRYMTT